MIKCTECKYACPDWVNKDNTTGLYCGNKYSDYFGYNITLMSGCEEGEQDVEIHWLLEYIDALSSADVVEVVRCKDCIHSYVLEPWEGTNAIRYCKTFKNHYGDSDMWVEDNDYCSYGRKIDE